MRNCTLHLKFDLKKRNYFIEIKFPAINVLSGLHPDGCLRKTERNRRARKFIFKPLRKVQFQVVSN